MKGLPRSIRLLGVTYRVSVVPQAKVGRQEKETELWGQYDATNNEIRLAEELSLTAQWETLIHEVLHVIDGRVLNEALAEREIQAVACGIFDLLEDNGFLAGKEEKG